MKKFTKENTKENHEKFTKKNTYMTKDSQNINEKKIQSYENHERIFVRIFFFVIFIWIFFSVVIFFVILHFAFKNV